MVKPSLPAPESWLFHSHPYEPQNHTEITLREAFSSLQPRLKPPLSPSLLSPTEYSQLNRAILYGILTQPPLAKTHFTHLCAIVTDGYEFFVRLLLKIVNESYPKLLQPVRVQLMWVSDRLMEAEAVGMVELVVSLLRQIVGGDYSSDNLWLSNELILVLRRRWNWVLGEECLVGACLYSFLRLLADHYRLANPLVDAVKQIEIEFCIMVLREHFGLCLRIGRDLIRLLQDVAFVPEFRLVWKDLLSNPGVFGVLGLSDISHIYRTRTPGWYFSLRITPEMETNLRFLLMNVKWGNQKRYQHWFKSKFLCSPERETLVPDLVRFICCGVHPSAEILRSNVISRWAVIGWLLKCCIHKPHHEANTKLAMFYDWLFFDEGVDDYMNLEPVMLLMVNSISQYIDITHTLLEFLFLVMDNYDVSRKDIIINGVSNSFAILVKKGFVDLMKLNSCPLLSPFLRDRLRSFCGDSFSYSNEPFPRKNRTLVPKNVNNLSSVSARPMDDTRNNKMLEIMQSVDNLGEVFSQSTERGLDLLEKLLFMWMTFNKLPKHTRDEKNTDLNPDTLADRITRAFKTNGYVMFMPLKDDQSNSEYDEVRSATAIAMRAFMLSNCEKMQKLMLFWSRNSLPVGPRLLSYASRLADEAQMALQTSTMLDKPPTSPGVSISNQSNESVEDTASGKHLTNKITPGILLKWHVDGHSAFTRGTKKSSGMSHQETDGKTILVLVEGAFSAYRTFLGLFRRQMLNVTHIGSDSKCNAVPSSLSKGIIEADECLTTSLVSDLRSCCVWQSSRVSMLFCTVFHHLPGLSTCNSDVIHLLVGLINHAHFVAMQFKVGLKRLTIFGKDATAICNLVKVSLDWNSLEQQRFWCLLTSELMVSTGEVPKILLRFCSQSFDPQVHSEALFGLFTLVRSQTPSLDLINAVLLSPPSFEDFSAAVLASWSTSNSPTLVSSLKEWLHEALLVTERNFDVLGSKSLALNVNSNAILEFLRFLNTLHLKSEAWNSKPDCISEVRDNLLKLAKKLDRISSLSKKWPS